MLLGGPLPLIAWPMTILSKVGTTEWDLDNDKPGPRLLHAVGLIKSIGVTPYDAVWAQGENDISYMDSGWGASRYADARDCHSPPWPAWNKGMGQDMGLPGGGLNQNLHIYIQKSMHAVV